MSKRCPQCGHLNDDGLSFCSACGEILDADLRLIRQLENRNKKPEQRPAEPARSRYVDEPVARVYEKKKKSPVPWIIAGVLVVAAVVLLIVLL